MTTTTLKESIFIAAPAAVVWHHLINHDSFRHWAAVFAAGSYYTGTWAQGETLRFAVDEDGKPNGLLSCVSECEPEKFTKLIHIGVIDKGIEDTSSTEALEWIGMTESYRLSSDKDGTTLSVEQTFPKKYDDCFILQMPKALAIIKTLAEQH